MAAAPARALAADRRSHPLRLLIISPISISVVFRLGSVDAPELQGFRVYRCRWGFAAAAAAPGRPPAAGVLETAPKPTKLPAQR
jgi:hypothetical protein